MRVLLWRHALVSIPLYPHHAGDCWPQQSPDDDDLRFWLPIFVPLAAFGFTIMSGTSWWWSTEDRRSSSSPCP
ncbi:hypothetical protein [Streptomyces sp. NPDC093260]|uniref:hypothetical protein n=1 Tax=Streptomyces sp. NPDC093260 TaxID=3155073 RepID=UPI003416EA0F